jgi:metal-sulfur cluster biosynthetic enzyme
MPRERQRNDRDTPSARRAGVVRGTNPCPARMDRSTMKTPERAFPVCGDDALGKVIEAALRAVVDPEMALNLADLGLEYGVAMDETSAHVRITMASAACPVAEVVVTEIEERLGAALPGRVVHVELCWEPPWDQERASDRARPPTTWNSD